MTTATAPPPPIDLAPETPETPNAAHRRSPVRPLLRLLKYALLAAVFWFVGRALWSSFGQIDWSLVRVKWGWVALSAVALMGVYASQLVGYRALLSAFARTVSWRTMAAVAWVPLLGKYVPGKVVMITGAIYLLRRAGVPAGPAVSSVVMLTAIPVVAGLMIGAPLLLTPAVRDLVPGGPFLVAGVIVGGLAFCHPAVFGFAVDLALGALKKPPLPRSATLRDYALPAMMGVTQWLAAGASLWCLARSIADRPGEVPLTQLPLYISIAALSLTVAYLALLAPGGLGVREGLLLATLGPTLGPKAAVVSVGLRVVQVACEVALFLVGTAFLRTGGGTHHGGTETRRGEEVG